MAFDNTDLYKLGLLIVESLVELLGGLILISLIKLTGSLSFTIIMNSIFFLVYLVLFGVSMNYKNTALNYLFISIQNINLNKKSLKYKF